MVYFVAEFRDYFRQNKKKGLFVNMSTTIIITKFKTIQWAMACDNKTNRNMH